MKTLLDKIKNWAEWNFNDRGKYYELCRELKIKRDKFIKTYNLDEKEWPYHKMARLSKSFRKDYQETLTLYNKYKHRINKEVRS